MRIAGAIRSLLLVSAIAGGVGQAVAQNAGDNPATYRGPDRQQRLLDGA